MGGIFENVRKKSCSIFLVKIMILSQPDELKMKKEKRRNEMCFLLFLTDKTLDSLFS